MGAVGDEARQAIESLLAAGLLREAAAMARSGLSQQDAPAASAAQLRLLLATILLMDGRLAEAVQETEAVLQHEGLPDELYVAADLDRLLALVTLGDLERAQRWAQAILAGDENPWADRSLAAALCVVGLAEWNEGRLRGALSLLTAATRRAERGSPELRRLHLHLGTASVLTTLGRFDEARTRITAARQGLDPVDDQAWAAGPSVVAAQLHLAEGRLDRAAAEAEDALEISRRRATRLFLPAAARVLASVALHRGDLESAERHVQSYRGEPLVSTGGLSRGAYLWTEAHLATARGERDRAAELSGEIFAELHDHRRLLVDEPAAAGWLVRTALAAGDEGRAEAVVSATEHVATSNPGLTTVAAIAAHARGLYEGDAATLVRAAKALRHPWARASALEDAGRTLARAGDRRGASRWLQEAVTTYRRAGAQRDAARARRSVHDVRHRRVSRTRPVTGWASLTETEQRVAHTVAEGHTNATAANQLFLSRHTVDFHLRQIFRKLAIRSRVELTRIVVEHAHAHSHR